jgi:hypothetical protein
MTETQCEWSSCFILDERLISLKYEYLNRFMVQSLEIPEKGVPTFSKKNSEFKEKDQHKYQSVITKK